MNSSNERQAVAGEARAGILLVDDSEDLLYTTGLLLERKGFKVHTAIEPMNALQLAKTIRPATCLVDIFLPGMDGYDLAARLQRIDPGMTIIGMSGLEREAKRELESGFILSGYLRKPFTADELFHLIESVSTSA